MRRFNAINCLFFMIKMIERNRAYENDCVEAPKPTPVTWHSVESRTIFIFYLKFIISLCMRHMQETYFFLNKISERGSEIENDKSRFIFYSTLCSMKRTLSCTSLNSKWSCTTSFDCFLSATSTTVASSLLLLLHFPINVVAEKSK